MLIQRRDDRLRLIRQHDHGLLSGELAAAWTGMDGSEGLDEEVILATALHDLAWRELDVRPRWNPETGLPHDFLDFPSWEKYEAAVEGIDRVADLHPYAGVLVSLHYTSIGSPGRPVEFEEAEEERRLELLADLEDEAPGPAGIRRDLDHLRLFDNLSLFLCLTPPGAGTGSRPPWLTPDLLEAPASGVGLALAWESEVRAVLEPFPFEAGAVDLELPFRDLPPGPFESGEALRGAWEDAEEAVLELRLEAGS